MQPAQKETLNQPGEQGNAITSHQMQSGKQLDDMHKENGKSERTKGERHGIIRSINQRKIVETIRTQNDHRIKPRLKQPTQQHNRTNN
ncbi:hypothetical protein ACV56Z_09660 [Staphylococcus aureus]